MHHRPRFTILAFALALGLSATCGEVPQEEGQAQPQGTPVQAAAVNEPLEIDFTARPAYLEKNVIVLTFDDGPDLANTPKVLDILKDKGDVKASFFINSVNQTDLGKDQTARGIVKRIVSDGHELANHSVHHPHLGGMSEGEIENEITGVQKAVNDILGAAAPRLTLFRAPYGEPYTGGTGSAAYEKVAPIVARHAVHIGWAIDTLDWACGKGDANCVYDNMIKAIKTPGNGAYGVVLLHSIQPQTAGALPRILDYLKNNGFVLKLTEDAVRAKFGKTSVELIGGGTGTGGAGGSGGGGSGGVGAGDASAGGRVDAAAADGGSAVDSSSSGGTGGGSGTTIKPDAGRGSSTGGAGGGGGSAGSGRESGAGPDDTGTGGRRAAANGGGCAYARGTQGLPLVGLSLVAFALSRRRRRRS